MAPALGVWVSNDCLDFSCQAMAMTHWRTTQFSVRIEWEGAAGGEISKNLFFGAVSSCVLAQPKSLAVEIIPGHSRREWGCEWNGY